MLELKTNSDINSSLCLKLNNMIDKIKPQKKITILHLSNFFYFLLSFGSNKDVYLNLLNGNVLVKASFRLEDFDFRKELFEKLYSSKILSELTLFSYLSIAKWKIKGYAGYISLEPDRFVEEDICYDDKKNEKGYLDFENKVVVSYLVEKKGYSQQGILRENLSYRFYLDEVKSYYCKDS
ncbi:MAG: hypothetical protein ACP5PA_04260 [Elusimicrobiales bacterium]